MIEAPLDIALVRDQLAISLVPLCRDCLRKAALFDESTYPLPKVLPGREAIIVDAACQILNFRRGIVTAYSYFTRLHTINVESRIDFGFLGREIVRARE